MLSSGAVCSIDFGKIILGYGEPTWSEAQLSYPCFYAPDFFLKEKTPYLQFPHTEEITPHELLSRLQTKSPVSYCFDPIQWGDFDHFFEKFKQSSLQKVVPYVVKRAKGVVSIQSMLYHALTYQIKNPRTAVYGFWNENEGMLGATPELIVALDPNGTLRSHACAGTMPIALADTMLTHPKLLQEHKLVIEGLKNSLGEVVIGETEVVKFSKLAHLFTPIQMEGVTSLANITPMIHPNPAIGAFPKEEGMQFLIDLDKKQPRGRFGAPYGLFLSENHARIYLAIRNIQWEQEKMQLMAGCGIVSDSDLLEEKQEIEHKLAAIHEILGVYDAS